MGTLICLFSRERSPGASSNLHNNLVLFHPGPLSPFWLISLCPREGCASSRREEVLRGSAVGRMCATEDDLGFAARHSRERPWSCHLDRPRAS